MARGSWSALTSPLLAAFVVCIAASPAAAPPGTFGGLVDRVSPGTVVSVTDREGQRTTAKIVSLAADRLEVLVRDERQAWRTPRTLVPGEVREIRRTEKTWDKALLGAGIASAIVGLAMAADMELDIDSGERSKNLLMAATAGAGLGFGVDAAFRPARLFRAEPPSRAGVSIGSPVGLLSSVARLTVRF